jgi:D-alanyl-D-alanine carboxypeptidase
VFAPGTSWSYSNTNYIVLGLILQRVSHRPMSRLLEQRIIRPLHLRHTYLPKRSPDIRDYYAHGYTPPSLSGHGYVDFSRYSPTWAWAAGALISNVNDLRRFYRALLGGRLLRPAQLAEMKTMVPVADGFGYGLGMYSLATPCGRIWGHDGGIPSYVTIAWSDESGRHGVTVGLATEPDERIGAAFNRLTEVAACRALGQAPPPATAGTRPAGRAADNQMRRVDLSPRRVTVP